MVVTVAAVAVQVVQATVILVVRSALALGASVQTVPLVSGALVRIVLLSQVEGEALVVGQMIMAAVVAVATVLLVSGALVQIVLLSQVEGAALVVALAQTMVKGLTEMRWVCFDPTRQ